MSTYPNVRYRLWALATPVFTLVIVAGALAALLRWHPGAYLAAAGLFGLIVSRCALALSEYRHVMSRPWPNVAASTDDWD